MSFASFKIFFYLTHYHSTHLPFMCFLCIILSVSFSSLVWLGIIALIKNIERNRKKSFTIFTLIIVFSDRSKNVESHWFSKSWSFNFRDYSDNRFIVRNVKKKLPLHEEPVQKATFEKVSNAAVKISRNPLTLSLSEELIVTGEGGRVNRKPPR